MLKGRGCREDVEGKGDVKGSLVIVCCGSLISMCCHCRTLLSPCIVDTPHCRVVVMPCHRCIILVLIM